MIGTKFWEMYDTLNDGKRFLIFLSIVAIPMAVLVSFNMLVGILYGFSMLAWRELSVKVFNEKKKEKNE